MFMRAHQLQAKLVAEKDVSGALMKERAEWEAERDALHAALEQKPQVCGRNEGLPRPMPSQQVEASRLRLELSCSPPPSGTYLSAPNYEPLPPSVHE